MRAPQIHALTEPAGIEASGPACLAAEIQPRGGIAADRLAGRVRASGQRPGSGRRSNIAMFSVRITDAGMREPHWHPETAEMGYVLEAGRG